MSRRRTTDVPTIGRGDRVAVVATGFACPVARLDGGLRVLERLGFEVAPGRHVREVADYFAGDDAARLDDLNRAIRDPRARAIWFARGGYGTARLLDGVDWAALARDPKLLVGYSDLTALFAPVASTTRSVCLHGPFVTELGDRGAWHGPSLRAMLAGGEVRVPIARRQVVAPGRASGRLCGGNLTVFAHLLGTRFAPELDGAILLLEETGEEAYRVDRLLTHLATTGALAKVRGVILGSVSTPPTRRRFPPDRRLEPIIEERFGAIGVPVVRDLPIGHTRGKRTVAIGGRATIDTRAKLVSFAPRP